MNIRKSARLARQATSYLAPRPRPRLTHNPRWRLLCPPELRASCQGDIPSLLAIGPCDIFCAPLFCPLLPALAGCSTRMAPMAPSSHGTLRNLSVDGLAEKTTSSHPKARSRLYTCTTLTTPCSARLYRTSSYGTTTRLGSLWSKKGL